MQYTLDNIANSKIMTNILGRVGVSTPPELKRSEEPWREGLLKGKDILIGGGSEFLKLMQSSLSKTGSAYIITPKIDQNIFSQMDHYTIPSLDNHEPLGNVQGILYDSSHLKSPDELKDLFHFFQAVLKFLAPSCRVVILSRSPQECESTELRSTVHAMTGYARSLAKELAKYGTTVQLLQIESDEEASRRAGPVTEFFLSDYASFVTGQVIKINARAQAELQETIAGSLAGKVALVTGAAGGIGAATVETLREEGAHVIALDHPNSEKALQELAKKFEATPLAIELGTDKSNEDIIAAIKKGVGKLDVIVHNAGITRDKTLKRMSEVHWNLVMSINLIAIMSLNKELLEQDMIGDQGRIICLSSISGIAGNFGQTNYACSKSGLIGYVEGMSSDLKEKGITVNAVAPGFIETQMTAQMPFVAKTFARRLASLAQGGKPRDVANVITFLSSPASLGINGSVIRVCGGHLIGA